MTIIYIHIFKINFNLKLTYHSSHGSVACGILQAACLWVLGKAKSMRMTEMAISYPLQIPEVLKLDCRLLPMILSSVCPWSSRPCLNTAQRLLDTLNPAICGSPRNLRLFQLPRYAWPPCRQSGSVHQIWISVQHSFVVQVLGQGLDVVLGPGLPVLAFATAGGLK